MCHTYLIVGTTSTDEVEEEEDFDRVRNSSLFSTEPSKLRNARHGKC